MGKNYRNPPEKRKTIWEIDQCIKNQAKDVLALAKKQEQDKLKNQK